MFGCAAGDDQLEHYMECMVLTDAFCIIRGVQAYNGPLRMPALAHECEDVFALRLGDLHVAFNTHNALRHSNGTTTSTTTSTTTAMTKARWTEFCGRSEKMNTCRLCLLHDQRGPETC